MYGGRARYLRTYVDFTITVYVYQLNIFYILELSRIEPIITQKIKRHSVIVAIKTERSNFEITRVLKVARTFVYKIRNELTMYRQCQNKRNIVDTLIQ